MNHRLRLLLFSGAIALGLNDAPAAATIEGVVTLPPGRSAPVVNQRYEIVAQAGILSTNPPVAVVYLEGDFPAPAEPAATASITQKDMTFTPALLPIRTGSRVEFPNFDDTYHNIFSYSPAKRFDLGRYRADESPVPSVLFDTAGLVVLRCDIHDHMRALIMVLATPHFVVTDSDGHFQLTGLPAGKYTLKAWLNSRTTLSQPLEIRDGEALKVSFP